jgi:hypothetical protein
VLLIAILAAETLVFAIVLLVMANKSAQSFPAFTLLAGFGPTILSFRE